MDDIKSFVALKYQILTSDDKSWNLCKTYPFEARSKWAWRCAADVEHLAKGYPEAEYCIEVAKKYRDGLVTWTELTVAYVDAYAALHRGQFREARSRHAEPGVIDAVRAAYAAAHDGGDQAVTASVAAHAGHIGGARAPESAAKWDRYIKWLVEELCAWESI